MSTPRIDRISILTPSDIACERGGHLVITTRVQPTGKWWVALLTSDGIEITRMSVTTARSFARKILAAAADAGSTQYCERRGRQ